MSFPSLLAELEVAVKIGTPEKRAETLRRLTGLFLDKSNQLNDRQISVFDDVLVHLIQKIETKALVQLSTSLAPVDNAPNQVIRRLSRHDEITVAGPVLTQSNRLSEADLVSIAKYRGQSHLLAISKRASLSEPVTDVLVDRGDVQVHHSLAKNAGARLSESSYSTLVNKSANDEMLAEKLGLRLDIPLDFLRRLLVRATDLVRSRLLASASPVHKAQVQRALAGIANEVGPDAGKPRDFARADSMALELNRSGRLSEAVLVEFIKERKYEELIATLALFCGVKSDLIERLMKNASLEKLLFAFKAAKLSWPTTKLILESRFSHHTVSEQKLGEARDAFLELSQTVAQRSMRFMQVQEAAKKAG